MHARREQMFPGVTPSFHLLNYQLSKQRITVTCPLTFYRQRTSRTFPEGVIAGGVAGRSVFDKIVDEGQHILFLPHIDEGIVAVGLFGVDEIEYPHFIAERQKKAPRSLQQFLR